MSFFSIFLMALCLNIALGQVTVSSTYEGTDNTCSNRLTFSAVPSSSVPCTESACICTGSNCIKIECLAEYPAPIDGGFSTTTWLDNQQCSGLASSMSSYASGCVVLSASTSQSVTCTNNNYCVLTSLDGNCGGTPTCVDLSALSPGSCTGSGGVSYKYTGCGSANSGGETPAEVVVRRQVASGQVGNFRYIVSGRQVVDRNEGSFDGNVFVAGIGALFGFPITTMGYVKGSVDVQTYSSDPSRVSVEAEAEGGAITSVFKYLGEYCNMDGEDGFQPGGSDYIINYFFAPQGAPWVTDGSFTTDVDGAVTYQASIQSANGEYNMSCKVWAEPTFVQERLVSPYSTKCDIMVDYTNLWSTNNLFIRDCPDADRYVGIAVDYAAVSASVDASVNLNADNDYKPDGSRINFANSNLAFTWDNYHFSGLRRDSIDLSAAGRRKLKATFLEDVPLGEVNGTVSADRNWVVKRLYFSFGNKAEGNFFYWDPTLVVTDPAVNPDSGSGGLSGGAIAGIIIGVVVGLLVIALIIGFILMKKKSSDTESV